MNTADIRFLIRGTRRPDHGRYLGNFIVRKAAGKHGPIFSHVLKKEIWQNLCMAFVLRCEEGGEREKVGGMCFIHANVLLVIEC